MSPVEMWLDPNAVLDLFLKRSTQGIIAHFQDTSHPDNSHFYVLLVIFQGIHHFVSFVTSLLIMNSESRRDSKAFLHSSRLWLNFCRVGGSKVTLSKEPFNQRKSMKRTIFLHVYTVHKLLFKVFEKWETFVCFSYLFSSKFCKFWTYEWWRPYFYELGIVPGIIQN